MSKSSVGLIIEMLSCCFLFIMLCNGLKMSEYEAYWLMSFLLINGLAPCFFFFFSFATIVEWHRTKKGGFVYTFYETFHTNSTPSVIKFLM